MQFLYNDKNIKKGVIILSVFTSFMIIVFLNIKIK